MTKGKKPKTVIVVPENRPREYWNGRIQGLGFCYYGGG